MAYIFAIITEISLLICRVNIVVPIIIIRILIID